MMLSQNIKKRQNYPTFLEFKTIKSEEKYLPSDPFWRAEEIQKPQLNKLLRNSSWTYGALKYENLIKIDDITDPKIFVKLQHAMNKEVNNTSNGLLTIGEYYFSKIMEYLRIEEIEGMSTLCKFWYIVIQAHLNCLYVKRIGQYPKITKLAYISKVLNSMTDTANNSLIQMHKHYAFYLKLGILRGITQIGEKVKCIYKKIIAINYDVLLEYPFSKFLGKFLSKKLIVEKRQEWPIIIACENNYLDVAKYLFKKKIPFTGKEKSRGERNCLEIAIINKNPSLMELLADNINDIRDFQSISPSLKLGLFTKAVYTNHELTLRSLFTIYQDYDLKEDELNTVFHLAISNNCNNMIQELITNGKIDINSLGPKGRTGLMESIKQKNMKIFEILIHNSSIGINILNSQGKSALYYAVKHSEVEIFLQLIDLGAKWKILTSKGNTLLHIAHKSTNPLILKLVIKHSYYAAFKRMNINGITPIHINRYTCTGNSQHLFEQRLNKLEEDHLIKKAQKREAKRPMMPMDLLKLEYQIRKKGKCSWKYDYELLSHAKPPARRKSMEGIGELNLVNPTRLPGEVTHDRVSQIVTNCSDIYLNNQYDRSFMLADEAVELEQDKLSRLCLFLFAENIRHFRALLTKAKKMKEPKKKKTHRIFAFKGVEYGIPICKNHKFLDNADIKYSKPKLLRRKIIALVNRNEKAEAEKVYNGIEAKIAHYKDIRRELHQSVHTNLTRSNLRKVIVKLDSSICFLRQTVNYFCEDLDSFVLFRPVLDNHIKKLRIKEYMTEIEWAPKYLSGHHPDNKITANPNNLETENSPLNQTTSLMQLNKVEAQVKCPLMPIMNAAAEARRKFVMENIEKRDNYMNLNLKRSQTINRKVTKSLMKKSISSTSVHQTTEINKLRGNSLDQIIEEIASDRSKLANRDRAVKEDPLIVRKESNNYNYNSNFKFKKAKTNIALKPRSNNTEKEIKTTSPILKSFSQAEDKMDKKGIISQEKDNHEESVIKKPNTTHNNPFLIKSNINAPNSPSMVKVNNSKPLSQVEDKMDIKCNKSQEKDSRKEAVVKRPNTTHNSPLLTKSTTNAPNSPPITHSNIKVYEISGGQKCEKCELIPIGREEHIKQIKTPLVEKYALKSKTIEANTIFPGSRRTPKMLSKSEEKGDASPQKTKTPYRILTSPHVSRNRNIGNSISLKLSNSFQAKNILREYNMNKCLIDYITMKRITKPINSTKEDDISKNMETKINREEKNQEILKTDQELPKKNIKYEKKPPLPKSNPQRLQVVENYKKAQAIQLGIFNKTMNTIYNELTYKKEWEHQPMMNKSYTNLMEDRKLVSILKKGISTPKRSVYSVTKGNIFMPKESLKEVQIADMKTPKDNSLQNTDSNIPRENFQYTLDVENIYEEALGRKQQEFYIHGRQIRTPNARANIYMERRTNSNKTMAKTLNHRSTPNLTQSRYLTTDSNSNKYEGSGNIYNNKEIVGIRTRNNLRLSGQKANMRKSKGFNRTTGCLYKPVHKNINNLKSSSPPPKIGNIYIEDEESDFEQSIKLKSPMIPMFSIKTK